MISFADPEAVATKAAKAYTFDLHQYKAIARKNDRVHIEQRINTPGMIPMRADMMVMCMSSDQLLCWRH